MRNFSIIPNPSQSAIDQYSDFLSREVYMNIQPYDVNDPLFLQQLGVLQAEGIRRAINMNSAVAYGGFQETKAAIADSADSIENRIGTAANMLTSSLDRGFGTLNNSLVRIDSGIETANTHLSNIHAGVDAVNAGIHDVNRNLNVIGNVMGHGFSALNVGINATNAQLSSVNKNLNALCNIAAQGFQALDYNLSALRNMVGVGFSKLYIQTSMSNELLGNILSELKIPETQRERRFHIEEGTKYLSIALTKGDEFYFEDAFDEFNKAIAIERKDFFSWFNIGVIYLRSKKHLDITQAISAFERYIHYAQAEAMHKQNKNLEHQIDDARLHLAESYYLQQQFEKAVLDTEQCVHARDKADFMKVKYLSATNDSAKKQEAAIILSQLIDKNPYITLQVLEDDDIVRNDSVIELLEKLRQETVKEAIYILTKIKGGLKGSYAVEQTKERLDKIENLIKKQTFLESCEAIYLMIKEYIWRARSGFSFVSALLDFEIKEKRECRIEINDFKDFIGITRGTHFDECIKKFGTPERIDDSYTILARAEEFWEKHKHKLKSVRPPTRGDISNAYFRDWLIINIQESSLQVISIEINIETATRLEIDDALNNNFGIADPKISLLGRHRDEFLRVFGEQSDSIDFFWYDGNDGLQVYFYFGMDDLCKEINVYF